MAYADDHLISNYNKRTFEEFRKIDQEIELQINELKTKCMLMNNHKKQGNKIKINQKASDTAIRLIVYQLRKIYSFTCIK